MKKPHRLLNLVPIYDDLLFFGVMTGQDADFISNIVVLLLAAFDASW